jgi:hypothetical protein
MDEKVIQQGSADEKASIVGCFFRQKIPAHGSDDKYGLRNQPGYPE